VRRPLIIIALVTACGGARSAEPQPAAAPIESAPTSAPDAGISEALASAPAWVFAYRTAERAETWTLRYAGSEAMLEIETAQGVMRYLGTAAEAASLTIDVSSASARMSLDCKRAQRALSAACNDTAAPAVDVLDCYHPDYDTPMPFGAAPGVEFVVDDSCNGYRLVSP
jgi:hypothetical protein